MNYIIPDWMINPFEMTVEHVSQETNKKKSWAKTQLLDPSRI